MKGQKAFTKDQIKKISELIAEKVRAPADRQKAIRSKIRKMGFYYSDFSSEKSGYTVADFDSFIRAGLIKISENEERIAAPKETRVVTMPDTTTQKADLSSGGTEVLHYFDVLKRSCFDPQEHCETAIADSPGNYIICLRKDVTLPQVSITPVLTRFNGLEVVYTGIASRSLRKRDYRQHFRGNNAGRSTLRKSLGVLFGYQQIPRDSDPLSKKTKFRPEDEMRLTDWMCRNLMMYFLPTENFAATELALIWYFNPPLNLKDNRNPINYDYRRLLSGLRRSTENKSREGF